MKRIVLKFAVAFFGGMLIAPFVQYFSPTVEFIMFITVGFACAISVDYAMDKLDSGHKSADDNTHSMTEQQRKIRNRLTSRTPEADEPCPNCENAFALNGTNNMIRIYECAECERRTFEKNDRQPTREPSQDVE